MLDGMDLPEPANLISGATRASAPPLQPWLTPEPRMGIQNVMPPTDPMDFPAEKGLSPRHTVFKGKGAKHAVMASAAPSVPPKINMPKPSMPTMVSNSAKGFAMSAMEQVGLTAAGGLAGGVASYSTGGDFNQGAMIGGGIAGGLTLGAGAVARKLGQDGIKASGYTGALGNLLSGFEDANVRRAMIGGGGLLGGMAFGGTRSHSQGFNKNRGTKIGH